MFTVDGRVAAERSVSSESRGDDTAFAPSTVPSAATMAKPSRGRFSSDIMSRTAFSSDSSLVEFVLQDAGNRDGRIAEPIVDVCQAQAAVLP